MPRIKILKQNEVAKENLGLDWIYETLSYIYILNILVGKNVFNIRKCGKQSTLKKKELNC